ncbi:NADH dehydrogenase alpha subcomplex subunit 8 [Piptocephalis cylindrospora]|uniref:NADH-ubiquinone oxidoreductase n=1 Tax=Piptocephalis cylindrospora TaxID=1907219 RepID=A0A4P9XZG3_9FUNG|nr:NADH dehydrogenase alpha subcomplex subunit 8 [Piptocephalis cylindrospora]|eukprot:RKP11878.1 NADH dehydrogenase alpha subcomplex subunit 8 [Piptocephalis cylindrospora]
MSNTPNDPFLSEKDHIEPAPMPSDVPPVDELGATSAPLASAAYYLGPACQEYTEDYMLCRSQTGADPAKCLKEGRRVTRCAASVLSQLKENCGKQFEAHWKCLSNRNYQYEKCRTEERPLNSCVFDKMKIEKIIPQANPNEEPVHLKKNPIFS